MEITEKHLLDILRAYVDACGSQTAAAGKLDMSLSFINDVLHERRDPTDKLAKKLGFRRVTRFVRDEGCNSPSTDG